MARARYLDVKTRQAEKQASRERDAEDLRTGAKTREQLWKENTALPAAMTSVNFTKIPVPR